MKIHAQHNASSTIGLSDDSNNTYSSQTSLHALLLVMRRLYNLIQYIFIINYPFSN